MSSFPGGGPSVVSAEVREGDRPLLEIFREGAVVPSSLPPGAGVGGAFSVVVWAGDLGVSCVRFDMCELGKQGGHGTRVLCLHRKRTSLYVGLHPSTGTGKALDTGLVDSEVKETLVKVRVPPSLVLLSPIGPTARQAPLRRQPGVCL